MTDEQHQQWKKDLEELCNFKNENKRLREVILLAPGTNEKGFLEQYKKWWDTFYREIRSPGCNLKNIEQALKGE